MKIVVSVLVSVLLTNYASAANVDSSFDGASGKIILPHLVIGDQIFYVELTLVDAASLTFQVNLESALDISPTDQTANTVASDLVGSWTVESAGGTSNIELVFNSDGSYTHFENIVDESGSCIGNEVGTYSWEASTGVFTATQSTDTNGDCGLSDPLGTFQFFIDGNTLTIRETGALNDVTTLTRVL